MAWVTTAAMIGEAGLIALSIDMAYNYRRFAYAWHCVGMGLLGGGAINLAVFAVQV